MNILVSAYTGLGNFILKTPFIYKIKELWPDAKIDLIVGNSFGAEFVLKNSEIINETYILKIKASFQAKVKFFLKLRKKRYDAIFLPFDAAPTFLILGALLLGGTKLVHINLNLNRNIKQKIRNFIYLFALPGYRVVPILQGRHEIDLNYDLLEAFYDRPMERTYQTFIAQKDDPTVLMHYDIKQGQYIVIQPSAANGSLTAKIWSPVKFEELLLKINQQYHGMKVVFVGDQGDRDSIKYTSLAEMDNVINTMGKTSIAALSTIIKNAAVVIAHDSGVMHIANALQVNLIALYGPTDYTRTRPLALSSHILFSKNDCLGAMYNFNANESELAYEYSGSGCMEGISVEDVMKMIGEIM